jgi:hypothetical protein
MASTEESVPFDAHAIGKEAATQYIVSADRFSSSECVRLPELKQSCPTATVLARVTPHWLSERLGPTAVYRLRGVVPPFAASVPVHGDVCTAGALQPYLSLGSMQLPLR